MSCDPTARRVPSRRKPGTSVKRPTGLLTAILLLGIYHSYFTTAATFHHVCFCAFLGATSGGGLGSTPGSMLRGLSVVPGMVSGSGGGTRDEDDSSKGEERISSSPVTCEAGTEEERL